MNSLKFKKIMTTVGRHRGQNWEMLVSSTLKYCRCHYLRAVLTNSRPKFSMQTSISVNIRIEYTLYQSYTSLNNSAKTSKLVN